MRCLPVGGNVAGETARKEESDEEEPEGNRGRKAMVDTSKRLVRFCACVCVRARECVHECVHECVRDWACDCAGDGARDGVRACVQCVLCMWRCVGVHARECACSSSPP